MRIGFVVNAVSTEHPQYTTTRLALAATRRGHDTWLMGVDDFSHRLDGSVAAHARTAKGKKHKDLPAYLEDVQADEPAEPISVDDLDVLFIRNDPADDAVERPWAVTSGILFGQLSVTRGTLVVNDPNSLANAVNKTYFQHFPEAVRPRTLISRDAGGDRRVHRRHGRAGRPQAAPGLRRQRRVLRVERRVAQPQPDDRGGRPRRLRRRPGGPARRRRGRRAAVRDERRAARGGRPPRRLPPREHDRRQALQHARRRRGQDRSRSPTPCSRWSTPSGPS